MGRSCTCPYFLLNLIPIYDGLQRIVKTLPLCEPKASTQDLIKPQRHKVHRERLCLYIGEKS